METWSEAVRREVMVGRFDPRQRFLRKYLQAFKFVVHQAYDEMARSYPNLRPGMVRVMRRALHAVIGRRVQEGGSSFVMVSNDQMLDHHLQLSGFGAWGLGFRIQGWGFRGFILKSKPEP